MPDFRDAILHDCVGFGDLCGDFSRSQIRGDLAFDVAGLQLGIVGVDQPFNDRAAEKTYDRHPHVTTLS
jgi:hypothetical protein